MNDVQFEILDELYFVISFKDIRASLDIENDTLLHQLREMVKKGWVKCFEKETEIAISDIDYSDEKFKSYLFLASKKGLFAHNSI
ncbi:hypothetical protein HZR84_12495 [Hyphobacterium sp. CCMP332]|nr:hypothetical protein HZR84_12495 [Hyphobacterium sp. CCMP332]